MSNKTAAENPQSLEIDVSYAIDICPLQYFRKWKVENDRSSSQQPTIRCVRQVVRRPQIVYQSEVKPWLEDYYVCMVTHISKVRNNRVRLPLLLVIS